MTTTTTTEQDADVLTALAGLLSAELIGSRALNREATATGFLAGYAVTLRKADGERVEQVVYLETKPSGAERPGVLRFQEDGADGVVDAWLYPSDPALPALGAAVYPQAAEIVLQRLGQPIAAPLLELIVYRPGKRAVVRAAGAERTLFLKVVRPDLAERIHAAHRDWRAAGVPVPRTLGWASEGLIALEDLGGAPAETALDAPEGLDALLDDLDRVSEAVARVAGDIPARHSLLHRLDWYCGRLTGVLPDAAERIERLCGRVRRRFDSAPEPVARMIHGDFHLGQLRVDAADRRTIVGLLDIDTAGLGDPADDLGAFAGHALATAAMLESSGDRGRAMRWLELAGAWIARWPESGGQHDRARAITATHLIAHALTGTAPAESLLELAETVLDETALIGASFPSHGGSRTWNGAGEFRTSTEGATP